jgi:hypothetical protein
MGRAIATCTALGLILGGAAACSDDDDDDNTTEPDGDGRLIIRMTDAPFPYALVESAVISIDSLAVRLDTDADPERWITVSRNNRDIDLLTLQNGESEVLVDTELEVGDIEGIRLHVDEATVTLTDQRDFDLDIPSSDEDGIDVPVTGISLREDQTTELLLDFDVSNSFLPTPAAPLEVDDIVAFGFDPEIRIDDLSESGSISGTAYSTNGTPSQSDDEPLTGAAVTIFESSLEVAGTATSADGSFHILGVPPGEYQIIVTAIGYVAATTTATVTRGQESEDNEVRLEPIGG